MKKSYEIDVSKSDISLANKLQGCGMFFKDYPFFSAIDYQYVKDVIEGVVKILKVSKKSAKFFKKLDDRIIYDVKKFALYSLLSKYKRVLIYEKIS